MSRLLLLFAMCVSLCQGIAQNDRSGWGPASYYPLRLGNTWKYVINEGDEHQASQVLWTVTSSKQIENGRIVQVWPTPVANDDDAAMLLVRPDTITEMSSGVVLVKKIMTKGDKWNVTNGSQVVRRIEVIAVEQSCHTAALRFDDCVEVEDVDDRLHLRTVTQYARGVGPVKIKYYDTRLAKRHSPQSIIELVEYSLTK